MKFLYNSFESLQYPKILILVVSLQLIQNNNLKSINVELESKSQKITAMTFFADDEGNDSNTGSISKNKILQNTQSIDMDF